MDVRIFASVGLTLVIAAPAAGQGGRAIPRMPDGRPDLTGIYDANTITPVERPAQFSKLILTDEEANTLARRRGAYGKGPAAQRPKSAGAVRRRLRRGL